MYNCALVKDGVVVNIIMADPKVDVVPDHTLVRIPNNHRVKIGDEYSNFKFSFQLNPEEIQFLKDVWVGAEAPASNVTLPPVEKVPLKYVTDTEYINNLYTKAHGKEVPYGNYYEQYGGSFCLASQTDDAINVFQMLGPYHYEFFLAVIPEARKDGYSSRVLRSMVEEAFVNTDALLLTTAFESTRDDCIRVMDRIPGSKDPVEVKYLHRHIKIGDWIKESEKVNFNVEKVKY